MDANLAIFAIVTVVLALGGGGLHIRKRRRKPKAEPAAEPPEVP